LASEGLTGVIDIEASVAALTVSVVLAVTPFWVAVIVVAPAAIELTSPLLPAALLTIAFCGAEEI
jgi:hypothetical protein